MIEHIEFDYELPSGNKLIVDARVAPGRPMRGPDLNGPGEPEEDPAISIYETTLPVGQWRRYSGIFGLDFDTTGLYLKQDDGTFKSLDQDIEERAWVAYSEQS